MSEPSFEFYTYLWLRLDGTPYYAGKGKGKRAFQNDGHYVPCPKDTERIILQHWPSEEEAFEAEKLLIAVYGRVDQGTGVLRNLTDGGDGGPAWEPSEERRAALRAGWEKRRANGRLRSKESYKVQGEKTRGRKQSREWVLKRAAKLRGRALSKEHKKKLAEALAGKPAPEGTAKNLRRIAASLTPEYRGWLGRKGAAKRWNIKFTDPEPPRCLPT